MASELSRSNVFDVIIIVGLLVITALLIMRVFDSRNDLLQEETFVGCSEHFGNQKKNQSRNQSKERESKQKPNKTKQDTAGSKQQNAEPEKLRSIKEVKEPNDSDVIFLFIYHNQCGHCHTFKPTWNRLCSKYHGTRVNSKNIKMLMVGNDTDEALWNTTSTQYKVTGFPTVMVIKKGSEPFEYNGPRTDMEVWRSNINKITA